MRPSVGVGLVANRPGDGVDDSEVVGTVPLAASGSSSIVDRFWTSIEFPPFSNGCWLWLGAVNHSGYGRLYAERRDSRAHRVAYEICVGPIPSGMVIDHLCRNKRCVNPAHLEAVTQGENVRRDHASRFVHRYASHCRHGHPLTAENVYWRGTRRECRQCRRIGDARRRGAA